MKRYLFIAVLLVLCVSTIFSGCEKLSDKEKQEIERYKKAPKDFRIIGKWTFLNDENKEIVEYFRQDGVWEYAKAIYNEKGEITVYKKSDIEVYYYTNKDSILNYYTVNRNSFYGSTSSMIFYKIDKDTLYTYTTKDKYRKGVKSDKIVIVD